MSSMSSVRSVLSHNQVDPPPARARGRESESENSTNGSSSTSRSSSDSSAPPPKAKLSGTKRKGMFSNQSKAPRPCQPGPPKGHSRAPEHTVSHVMVPAVNRTKCCFRKGGRKCNKHTKWMCSLCGVHFCKIETTRRGCWDAHIRWCSEYKDLYSTRNVKKMGELDSDSEDDDIDD